MRLPPVQETIHWLEVGQGARVLRILVGVLLLIGLFFWYDFFQARNFSAPDAMEMSQLARNLAHGEGFTTKVVRPLTIQWVEDTQGVEARLGRQPHPDLFSPPLYPLLLAAWMKVLPFDYEIGTRFWRYQPELLIAILNQALFLVVVWATFRLTRRLVSGEAGVLVALLLLASELLWRFSASGLPTMLLMLLVVGLLGIVVRIDAGVRAGGQRPAWYLGWGALAGLALGLIGLTRYGALALLVPVTLYYVLFLDQRAIGVLVATWVVCAAVVTPWLLRNHALCGHWFGVRSTAIYQETMRFPGNRLERSFEPDVSLVETLDLVRKGSEGLRSALTQDLLKPGGTWFGAFFLVGLIGQYRNPATNRLRVFLFFSLGALAFTQSLGRTHLSTDSPTVNSENLLISLTPGLYVVGVAFYYWLLDRFQLPFREFRHLISAGVLAGTAVPLLIGFLPPRSIPVVYPPYYPPHLQETAQYLKPNEALMSDMPWAMAWYGDRLSVWVPMDARQSFYTINDDHKAISGLLLGPLTTDSEFRRQILQSRDHDWARLMVEVLLRTNVPPGFPLRHAWQRGTPDHLFLSDRPRWLEAPRESAPGPPSE